MARIGLVATPGALMITGPVDTDLGSVKIQRAQASDPEETAGPRGQGQGPRHQLQDKAKIMRHIHQMARERNGPRAVATSGETDIF